MSKYNFDEIVDRRNSGSYKWDIKNGELPMWVADMDFHVLPEIKQAIIDRANIDAYGYSECPKEYFEVYKKWAKRRHGLDLKTEWMVFSNGVVASIDSILKHLVPQGSKVVVQSPVYHVFYHCIENNGLKVLENKLIARGNYEIDFDNLEQLLKQEDTKAMILCNPHNPVGRIWSKEELKRIAGLCGQYNVLLISDEIHCDIIAPGEQFNSIYSLTDKAIALVSPTKTFNVAGLHTSLAICADAQLREQISKGFGQDDIGEPNYIAGYASIAAFKYGDDWVKEMNEYVFNNKKYMQEFLQRELPDITMVDNKATYLLWLDISKFSNDSDQFVKELREQTGLFVSTGNQFGSGGQGHIRINVATSLDNVKDACKRLQKYVKTL